MKLLLLLILATLCVISCSGQGPSSPFLPYHEIKRIRPIKRQTKTIQEVDDFLSSPTLSVLSHLGGLRPNRRHYNPVSSESRIQQLPLQSLPAPLPLQEPPKRSLERLQYKDNSKTGTAYRPRPERPPRIRRPPSYKSEGVREKYQPNPSPKFGQKKQSQSYRSETSKPKRPARPARPERPAHPERIERPERLAAYQEDGTIYRKEEAPVYSEDPVKEIPSYLRHKHETKDKVSKLTDAPPQPPRDWKPFKPLRTSSLPRNTRFRNRPQYSGERFATSGTEIYNPYSQPKELEHNPRPEKFDFPIKRPSFPNSERFHKGSRLFQEEPVFETKKQEHNHNFEHHVPEFEKRIPIKVLQKKKKKVSPHHLAPLSKEFKKDKRAIAGGAHLDKNGIEFAHEVSKVETGNRDGRIAFQMHGQQGPHSYRFGYDTGKGYNRQFRFEERDGYGEVKGRYGYYDKSGKLQVVNYSAHPKHGFTADVPKH